MVSDRDQIRLNPFLLDPTPKNVEVLENAGGTVDRGASLGSLTGLRKRVSQVRTCSELLHLFNLNIRTYWFCLVNSCEIDGCPRSKSIIELLKWLKPQIILT
jgi:hypothetical protein